MKKRGLTPVADNDGKGFESFRVKDPDGFDLQISNGGGYTKQRKAARANAKLSEPPPFDSTGWKTVWLDHFSFNVSNYKESASFYQNLLGWKPTYDEGSQHELMIGEVGDIIIRGGNPFAANFKRGRRAQRAHRSHLVRHLAVGHRRREGRAREARTARAGGHVHRRRHPRRRVQELPHGDAERIQPADQLRDARQPARAAECGEAEEDGSFGVMGTLEIIESHGVSMALHGPPRCHFELREFCDLTK